MQYYIYAHRRKDNDQIFYIGKGTIRPNRKTNKSKYYRAYSTQGRSKFWNRIVNKHSYYVDILFHFDNELDAFEKERELISFYGRRDLGLGPLCNLTNGGEGESGRIVTEEAREKYRKINKGRKHSKEVNLKKGLKGDKNPMYGVRLVGELNPFYGKKHREESKRYGKDNHMYGMVGSKNPFYGRKHNLDFLRRKQILHSNKVLIVENGKETIFECVRDCAEYLGCTTKNILYRDKQNKKGLTPKTGIFSKIHLKIIK